MTLMTLATELNPHETELNPHEAVPGRLAVPGRIKSGAFPAHGAEFTSTQPTGAGAGGHAACDPRHP